VFLELVLYNLPGTIMKLILIRHAQSVRNAAFKGNTFYRDDQEKLGLPNHVLGLTEKGREQARDAAQKILAGVGVYGSPTVILHSGYVRARDTANIIHEEFSKSYNHEIEFEQNHLLRERDAGHAFEMSGSESRHHFPFLEDHWKFEGKWFAVPPGGESFIQVMDRVSTFLHILSQESRPRWRDGTIYAVTHGGTMRAFQLVVEKIPFEEAEEQVTIPKNCEMAGYQYVNGSWKTWK
jgi:broad specificity phosphatase PhoE